MSNTRRTLYKYGALITPITPIVHDASRVGLNHLRVPPRIFENCIPLIQKSISLTNRQFQFSNRIIEPRSLQHFDTRFSCALPITPAPTATVSIVALDTSKLRATLLDERADSLARVGTLENHRTHRLL